jgi:hypothetical protein
MRVPKYRQQIDLKQLADYERLFHDLTGGIAATIDPRPAGVFDLQHTPQESVSNPWTG